MRQLRYIDYDCPDCEAVHTRFVYFDTENRKPLEDEVCGALRGFVSASGFNLKTMDPVHMPVTELKCEGALVPREMSDFCGYVGGISKNNSDFNERERARLEKRQDDHWKKRGRDEAIDRERAYLKKHGAVGGVR